MYKKHNDGQHIMCNSRNNGRNTKWNKQFWNLVFPPIFQPVPSSVRQRVTAILTIGHLYNSEGDDNDDDGDDGHDGDDSDYGDGSDKHFHGLYL